MSKRFESAKELAWKISWEGGAREAMDWGITLTDFANIEGEVPGEVVGAWAMAEMAKQFYDTVDAWVATVMEDDDEDADHDPL